MIDKEKVIRALKCISADPNYEGSCDGCPYLEPCEDEDEDCLDFCDEKHLAADVLTLLKEQEPVPVEWQGIPLCGACHAAFLNLRPQKYCHECGRKVKWK